MKRFTVRTILDTERINIDVYQQFERCEVSIVTDWSEPGFILAIAILFWCIEFTIYASKRVPSKVE
jgi:hypothetical protein